MAGEDRKEAAGSQKSKDDEGGSVRLVKNPYISSSEVWRSMSNLTDARKVHLAVAFPYLSGLVSSRKLHAGKPHVQVRAADGGQRVARLLRPDCNSLVIHLRLLRGDLSRLAGHSSCRSDIEGNSHPPEERLGRQAPWRAHGTLAA